MKDLTPAQRDGVRNFGGNYYGAVRAAERGAPTDARGQGWSDAITAGLAAGEHKPCVVYRAIDRLTSAQIEAMIAAEHMVLGGTSSTTWDAELAISWKGLKDPNKPGAVMYVLNQRSGVLVDHPQVVPHREQEVMMPRTAKFRTTGVVRASNGTVIIYADEISEEEYATLQSRPAQGPHT